MQCRILAIFLEMMSVSVKYRINNQSFMCLVFTEVDLLQLLDMQSAAHYNVSTTEDDRGCPAYQIGQYATLSLPTATVFGPL